MYSKLPIILRKKASFAPTLIFKWLLADRLCAAVNKDAMQSCAHSETLLLQAYNVSPPPHCMGSEPPGIRDSVATGVLQLYHPCL